MSDITTVIEALEKAAKALGRFESVGVSHRTTTHGDFTVTAGGRVLHTTEDMLNLATVLLRVPSLLAVARASVDALTALDVAITDGRIIGPNRDRMKDAAESLDTALTDLADVGKEQPRE